MTQFAIDSAQIIKNKITFEPKFGIILGSGLGILADQIEKKITIPYQQLPGFPVTAIEGQKTQLIIGEIGSVPVVCLQGRAHYYEGKESVHILTYIRTLKLLGCHSVIITGAVGSLRAEIKPGQIVLLKDHINFQGKNPLVGENDEAFGPRFPDMTEVYDKNWRIQLEKVGHDRSLSLIEGVYISVLGPSFETPAEIRLFREWGADVIGMSVVSEAIASRHCGLRVIGMAMVTNLTAGLSLIPQSHEETLETAKRSVQDLVGLITGFLSSI